MWSHDFRLAARALGRSPAFTIVALLTLAIGVGANTAIFSVIDTVLLRAAPIRDIDNVAVIWETDRNSGTTREPGSLPDYVDYKERARQVEQMAAFMGSEVNFAPPQGEPVRLQALEATHDLLPLLGISPIAGRGFDARETTPGGPRVVVIGEAFWTRALGRDPAALGRTLTLNDAPHTIVGIMPHSAEFGAFQILSAADYSRSFADRGARAGVDIWLPFQESAQSMPRSTHPIIMVGRLRGDIASAQAELASISADLERAYRENAARGIFVEPLSAVVFGPVRPALLVLLAAVGLVLLVACVNVANLLLVRGSARRREVAVRLALGAGMAKLARHFIAEGVLLALLAAVLGAGVAVLALRGLVSLAPADVPRIADASVDLRVLAIMLTVSLVAGTVFGLVPLLQAFRFDLQGTLKAGGHGGSGGRERGRLRSALVVAESALAVMLVIGAALLIRSFWRLQQVDPGFTAAGTLKGEYQLPASRYPVDFSKWPHFNEIHAFADGLLRRAASLPGVEAAAIAGHHPLDPGFTNSFVIVGREAEARTQPEISLRRVSASYFRTVSLPLLRGRLLAESDTTDSQPVVVINDAAAQRFFASQDPLGKQIAFWGARRTIVGVVANERFHGLTQAPPIAAYAPHTQAPSVNGVVLLRTSGDPAALAGSLRGAVREQDSALAVFAVEPLTETVSRSVSERRFTMLVLGLLAAVALLLAAIGIHGVLSYAVEQRRREIGIRMALGAQPSRVLRQVVGEGVGLAAAGAAIGLAGAWLLTRAMNALLFGVTATDPLTFAIVPAVLASVALVASYVPARRAMRLDPVRALRAE
jgi:putative ABC transport system permease protein